MIWTYHLAIKFDQLAITFTNNNSAANIVLKLAIIGNSMFNMFSGLERIDINTIWSSRKYNLKHKILCSNSKVQFQEESVRFTEELIYFLAIPRFQNKCYQKMGVTILRVAHDIQYYIYDIRTRKLNKW